VGVAGQAVELGDEQHAAPETALGHGEGELGAVSSPAALHLLEGRDDGAPLPCRAARDRLALRLEPEAVLTRASVLEMAGISAEEVLAVLDEVAGVCVPVAFDFRVRPGARDPDDDLVLETVVNGGADVIAAFNLTDLRDGAARFGILVERPADVLMRMRG
jgi:hypothetical protein